jgi:pectin methylesterase-like acyl-CoA thioesterase
VKRILLNSILVSAFIALTAMALDARACEYTVATDGSGQFKSVQAAVDKVPANNKTLCTIRIKPGTYIEQVRVPADKPYVSFIGENAETTKLTYKISNKDAGSTSAAYATYIGGHDFQAENIALLRISRSKILSVPDLRPWRSWSRRIGPCSGTAVF